MNARIKILAALGLALALCSGLLMAHRAQAQTTDPPEPLDAQAEVGTAFTYQGRLMHSDSPVSGTCNLDFSLYDAASAGNQIGANQLVAVTVQDGFFSADLNGSGEFGSQAFTGQARYLQITINNCTGGGGPVTLSPRVALNPTPYAHSLRPGASINGGNTGLFVSGDLQGLSGNSDTGIGVYGQSQGGSSVSGVLGWGFFTTTGVYGRGDAGYGVRGLSNSSYGVYGQTNGASNVAGVVGASLGAASGVEGNSATGWGVYGYSASGTGVYARGGVVDLRLHNGTLHATEFNDSKLELHSNDDVDVYLDDDREVLDTSYFRILDSYDSAIFTVDEAGATTIVGSKANGNMLRVSNGESINAGTAISSTAFSGYGLWAESTYQDAVHGESINGHGVYGHALSNASAGGYFKNVWNSSIISSAVGVWAGSYGGDILQGWDLSSSGDPNNLRFRVTWSGDVYADSAYHCGQGSGGDSEPGTCVIQNETADFAEMLPAQAGLEPGDVLVVGPDGQLTRSNQAYQATVVGIYSTQPGYLGGGKYLRQQGYAPLAVVGVVPVKASAENGPIAPGDLLTTANTPGHAMRCAGLERCFGRTIGKALEGLENGSDVITVLVTLQ